MSKSPLIIKASRLEAYFHQHLVDGVRIHRIAIQPATVHYLTLLLCNFSRSDQFFDHKEDGLQIHPLALLYKEAIEAKGFHQRNLWLQRLGDVALFVASVFSGQLGRRFNDPQYCVAMGGNAYGHLENCCADRPKEYERALIFGELAENFEHIVPLISETTGAFPLETKMKHLH